MKTGKFKRLKCYQIGGYVPTALTDSAFIPTYAGSSLGKAEKYAGELGNVYDKNIEDLTKLDILNAQRKVLPGDETYSREYNQQLEKQMQDLARRGDYENLSSQVNEMARRHFRNPRLKAMNESYVNAERRNKMVEELKAKGIPTVLDNDPGLHQTISINPETGKEEYNIYHPTVEARLPYDEKMYELWKPLHEDVRQLTANEARQVMQAIPGYISTGTWKGISGGIDKNGVVTGKVGQLLRRVEDLYKKTGHGIQQQKVLEAEGHSPEEAAAMIRHDIASSGLIKTFQETYPEYHRDWMLEDQLQGQGKNKEIYAPDLETGVRLPLKEGEHSMDNLLSLFNPKKEPLKTTTMLVMNDGRKVFPGKNAGDLVATGRAKWDDSPQLENFQRGTKEQRAAYEKLARKVVDPAELKRIYEQHTTAATQEKAEKDFLYSPDVYKRVEDFKKNIEDKLYFNVMRDYANTEEGQKQQRIDSNDLKIDWANKVFFDFDSGKIVSPEKQGGVLNSSFADMFPKGFNPENLEVVKHTMGKNPYGKVTGDPRFYNSRLVNYFDKATQTFKKFLVADNIYKADPSLQEASDIWATTAQQPYQKVDYRSLDGKMHAQIEDDGATDEMGNNLLAVHSVAGKELPAGTRLTAEQLSELFNELRNKKK